MSLQPCDASRAGGPPPQTRPVLRTLSLRTCALVCALLAGIPACGAPATAPATRSEPAPAAPVTNDEAAEAHRLAELPHRVVFADRITYSYVLLLPGEPGAAPTREELDAAIIKAFPNNLDDEEVSLLRGLIARPLTDTAAIDSPLPDPETPPDSPGRRASDLLGLAIELHPRAPTGGPALIEPKVLQDPDLTRELTAEEGDSLATRGGLLVLRAQYRNQHAVRGLRLLQTLVRVVASQRGALIHDPDTLETMGPTAFAARRLQTSLGNVADQIPVVPFTDPAHAGRLRLATRGMRRFGSVDLELGGLPTDVAVLQQGTFFLHGLALSMIELGEFDSAGFAAELPAIVTVHYSDCAGAYGGRPGTVPRCGECPESAEVHLVERAAEPQDAVSHVVARVVAPRSRSDRPDYDHTVWVHEALDRVLGRPGPAQGPH